MLKVTGPPIKVLAQKKNYFKKNTNFYNTLHSVWQIMLLQESFENHNFMPSVEAAGAAGHVLRTTGDAASCVSS